MTLKGEKHHGLTGYERCLVYKIGVYTGLRWNEIVTLQRCDIGTVGNAPVITVRGKNAKNRKTESVPLKSELALELAEYFKRNPAVPKAKSFSGIWQGEAAGMLKRDLKAANNPFENEYGVADFYSLRHTCGTWLALSGVPPQFA